MTMATDHATAAGNYQNLFVAKLPLSITDAELMQVFADFGPSNATVMLDPVTGRSKGYAFVLFPQEQAGRDAAAALDKTHVSVPRPTADNAEATFAFDLTVFASKHSGKEVAVENECLYIRNIPNSWPMERVESFIAEHGKPVYSAVRTDHLGSPVWVVFVEYDSVESARRTLKAVHGMVIAPRCPPILAKYAENEDVKRNRRDRKLGRGSRARNTTAERKTKPARRIDVAHQMQRPCHAARFDAAGTRVYAEDDGIALQHIISNGEASMKQTSADAPLSANECVASVPAELCHTPVGEKSSQCESHETLQHHHRCLSSSSSRSSLSHTHHHGNDEEMMIGAVLPFANAEEVAFGTVSSRHDHPRHRDDHHRLPHSSYRYRHDPYSATHAPIVVIFSQ